ncbi:hypothetical protein DH09_05210 [Bacillaceae bacterium JMAK1]|nr:hypothetical protein DH09_05210 [Bacillaceae bacterium JMAK1]
MGNLLLRIEQLIQPVLRVLHMISNIILFLVAILITCDVIGRFFFNQPIKGAFELTEFGSAILIFFALAVTHRHREHIVIGFAVDKLAHKPRHLTEGMIELFVCVLLFLMGTSIFLEGIYIMNQNVITTDLQLPLYPFILLISIGAFMFALTALLESVKHFRRAVEKA